MTERFLPVEKQEEAGTVASKIKNDYIFQPDKKTLLEELARKILNTQFSKPCSIPMPLSMARVWWRWTLRPITQASSSAHSRYNTTANVSVMKG
jgi:hypothetical protein